MSTCADLVKICSLTAEEKSRAIVMLELSDFPAELTSTHLKLSVLSNVHFDSTYIQMGRLTP